MEGPRIGKSKYIDTCGSGTKSGSSRDEGDFSDVVNDPQGADCADGGISGSGETSGVGIGMGLAGLGSLGLVRAGGVATSSRCLGVVCSKRLLVRLLDC